MPDDAAANSLHWSAEPQEAVRVYRGRSGVDEGTIRNIFHDYVNELEEQFEVETPTRLGIDEIHIFKPCCVVANIESKTIANIAPERNKKTVATT